MLFLGFAAVPSMVAPTPPKVSAPADFVAPTPKPLTMTRPPQEALPGLITGGMALAVRLATGAEDARTTGSNGTRIAPASLTGSPLTYLGMPDTHPISHLLLRSLYTGLVSITADWHGG